VHVRLLHTALLTALFALGAGCGSGLSGAESSPPAAAPSLASRFDQAGAWAQLERIVAFGPRPAGSASLERLRRYLEAELASYGLTPHREAFRAKTPIGELSFCNLVAELPGDSERTIVLGSHIDTKRLPFHFVGANDGGSSTALLLELARVLAQEELRRPVSYRFVFFDGEEAVRREWSGEDSLYGSRHHVAALRANGELERVRACVLLDMVGDAHLRLTTETSSTPGLLAVFFAAAKELGLDQHVGGPARELSDDHLPFLRAGIPSVDLIDFEFGPVNRYWHTRDDTLQHCSEESLAAIGRIVQAGLPLLDIWLADTDAR